MKRLDVIASFVDDDSYIADIGSGHALIPIMLFEQGKIKGAELIENKRGPFGIMKENIEKAGFLSSCHLSLSSGCDDLDKEADTLIIAGMGGLLISKILEQGKDKFSNVKTVIIDAHKDFASPIKTLYGLGFSLEMNETFWENGIYYDVMKWSKRPLAASYSVIQLEFGPLNVKEKNEAWKRKLELEIGKLKKIAKKEKISETSKKDIQSRIDRIEEALNYEN